VIDDVSGVGAYSSEHRGWLGMQPTQADGVQPRVGGDPPDVSRISPLVQHRQVHPAEVELVTRCPHDGADARDVEVEFGGRRRREIVVGRSVIGRRVDAGRSDVRVEHRPEFLVERPFANASRASRSSLNRTVAPVADSSRPYRRIPWRANCRRLMSWPPPSLESVDRSESRGRRGEILDGGEGNADLRAVQEPLQQSPDEVATAVPARGAGAHRDGEVHLAPGLVQLLGDLGARLAGADHEHGTVGELPRPAVEEIPDGPLIRRARFMIELPPGR
jgi:hypothetical protein